MDPGTRQIGWLLTEVERESSRSMTPLLQRELIDEAAAHLDASIQARLELGMDPEVATREAVHEFGDPREFVKEIRKTYERANRKEVSDQGSKWAKVAGYTMVSYAAFAILCTAGGTFDWRLPLILVGAAIAIPAFAWASFKSRRLMTGQIAAGCLAAYVGLNLLLTLTWHNLSAHRGSSVLPGWQADSFAVMLRSEITQADSRLSSAKLSVEDRRMYEQMKSSAETNLAALDDAIKAPALTDLDANLHQTYLSLPITFVVTALINLIFGGLGFLVSRFGIVRKRTA